MKKVTIWAFALLCVGCKGQHPSEPWCVIPCSAAFSHDGKQLLTGLIDCQKPQANFKRLILWDTETGNELWSREGVVDLCPVGFLADGKTAVIRCGEESFQAWDMEKGKFVRSFACEPWERVTSNATLSGDGKLLFARVEPKVPDRKLDRDYRPLALWDVSSGTLVHRFGQGLGLGGIGMAISQDGKLAITLHSKMGARGKADSILTLWNCETGEEIKSFWGKEGPIALSLDGKVAANQDVKGGRRPDQFFHQQVIWNVATGNELARIDDRGAAWEGRPDTLMAFSSDGAFIITGRPWTTQGSESSFTLSFVEWANGKVVWTATAKEIGKVRAVAFSKNGKLGFIGSGSSPRPGGRFMPKTNPPLKLTLWDFTTGKPLRELDVRPFPEEPLTK